MTAAAVPEPSPHPGMGDKQFIALIAALMAINAIAVDSMLPALPTIAATLGLASSNQQQWIVTAYLLGFGATQIVYGPVADRFGRKPTLLVGLAIYIVCSLIAASAGSFGMLIVARVLQGVGSASTRVLSVSIVRDCYQGSKMARVMSFAFIVFLAVPIIAPSLGQLVMLAGPWRWIFIGLALFAAIVSVWTVVKLPETLRPEDRLPIAPSRIAAAFRVALTNRIATGYMLAMAMMLGGLFGFINSAQQIFDRVFGAARLFPVIFAAIAFFMACSSLLNASIVEKLGTRRVSHTALLVYVAAAALHVVVSVSGAETLLSFALFQAVMMGCFGLVVSNFGAMAMAPLGHLAGTGSSVQGFVTTLGGALIGLAIGQQFNGTTVPLTLGFLVTGVLALCIVMFAEHGRLFRRHGLVMEADAGAAH